MDDAEFAYTAGGQQAIAHGDEGAAVTVGELATDSISRRLGCLPSRICNGTAQQVR